MSFVLRNIHKSFGDLQVLQNLNMEVEEKKLICILGPSGSGKTTLLNLVSGVLQADQGEILGFAGKSISYLFQENRLLPWKTAEGNIDFVLKDKLSREERKESIARYLEMVGLTGFKDYYPAKLSGGMKQRVAIARAFAYPAEILLMDEPFKGLDLNMKLTLIEEFLSLWMPDRRSVFFVTHDLQEALLMGEEIYVLTNRPAMVKGKVINPIPHTERKEENPALRRIEQEIRQLISE